MKGFNHSVVNDRACAGAAPTDLSADEIKAILSDGDKYKHVECLTHTALEAPEDVDWDLSQSFDGASDGKATL